MKEEVKAQLKRVEMQIETEQQVYKAWKCFTDSDMKTAVINQSIGVVRGLEVAREALQFILDSSGDNQTALQLGGDYENYEKRFEENPADLVAMGKVILNDIVNEKALKTSEKTGRL